MRKYLLLCGVALAISLSAFYPFTKSGSGPVTEDYQGPHCQGCERTAVLASSVNTHGRPMESYLVENATSPCFHLMNKDVVLKYDEKLKSIGLPPRIHYFKEPEYYFTVNYEETPDQGVESRLIIKLFFYTDELVHQWETVSGRSTYTFNGHLNRMFKNRDAVFRQSVPLDVFVLNEFEKQPYNCDISPEKEKVFPGEEIRVTVTNIRDIEDEQSREFNRLVVQAVNGEITGGTTVEADPDLKAFLVGKGKISFTYEAPSGNSGEIPAEDKIVIYNSCEIMDPSKLPLSKTLPKDIIARKTINIDKKKPVLIIRFNSTTTSDIHKPNNYSKSYSHFSGTVQFFLKLASTSSSDNEIHHSYEAAHCNITGFSGHSSGEKKSWRNPGSTRTEITECDLSPGNHYCPSSAVHVIFSKDGPVKNVELGGFELEVCMNGKTEITDYDGKRYTQTIPYPGMDKMSISEMFILDPKMNMGTFKIEGTDQGNMHSGIITGNRTITGGNEYSTSKKQVSYRLYF